MPTRSTASFVARVLALQCALVACGSDASTGSGLDASDGGPSPEDGNAAEGPASSADGGHREDGAVVPPTVANDVVSKNFSVSAFAQCTLDANHTTANCVHTLTVAVVVGGSAVTEASTSVTVSVDQGPPLTLPVDAVTPQVYRLLDRSDPLGASYKFTVIREGDRAESNGVSPNDFTISTDPQTATLGKPLTVRWTPADRADVLAQVTVGPAGFQYQSNSMADAGHFTFAAGELSQAGTFPLHVVRRTEHAATFENLTRNFTQVFVEHTAPLTVQ